MITEKIKNEVKEIVKSYPFKVRVYYSDLSRRGDAGGMCRTGSNRVSTIMINKNLKSRRDVLNVLFHELGHVNCSHYGLFKAYHGDCDTKKQVIAKLKQGLRAERYVDAWGERECNKYDARIKWVPAYRSKADLDWWEKTWKARMKKSWNIN